MTSEKSLALNYSETKKKSRLKIMGVDFVYIYLIGIGFAFIGWFAENMVRLITQGIFDCRFHFFPFISAYALIPFAFQILLNDPDRLSFFGHRIFKKDNLKNKILSNILCLVLILGAVFLAELAIGNMWEMLFGVQLWNYSAFPLHVTQYAGLIPTLGYGGGAFILFRFVYRPLVSFIQKHVKYEVAKTICLTLGVIILLDTLAMILHIVILHEAPMYWSIKLW